MEKTCLKEQINTKIYKDDISKEYLQKEGYKYCLLYYLNDLVFSNIDEIEKINTDILVEGFFFNEKKELHFFEDNGFEGILTENNGEDQFEETFILKKNLGNNLKYNKYNKLKVVHYLGYEGDGQAYIKYTALKGVC